MERCVGFPELIPADVVVAELWDGVGLEQSLLMIEAVSRDWWRL
jgi:hypothetical protein